jgi:predicted dithiol-disulfide oxidoreductase (DUF899 family)
MKVELAAPRVVDPTTFQAELDALRVPRRRLPMVEVDGTLALIGECGKVMLPDTFEGRWILIAHFMWNAGRPAPEQCDG